MSSQLTPSEQHKRRMEILGITSDKEVTQLDNIRFSQLRTLVEEGLHELSDEGVNRRPPDKEFYELMRKYPDCISAEGIIIAASRPDHQVILDTLNMDLERSTKTLEESEEIQDAFLALCRDADDFVIKRDKYFIRFFAWWD